jgi:para-nitrobenzyl esterase
MNLGRSVIPALLLSAFSMTAALGQRVLLDSGPIEGSTEGKVSSFKGIPYAAAPVGELRWRAPQPVKPWTAVRAAKTYASDCMQNPFPGDAAPLGTPPAEDCLYANVWRPAGTAPGTKLPVMVWIYGGGFVNGGSSPAVYAGDRFAAKGVVLVSFNYRLGRFGFFGFPELTKRNEDGVLGNYGFMDQIAALQWVKRNAASFGGDASNVTIFGESAGGFSVHALLTTPMAKGLFEKAIIESGGGRMNLSGERYLSTQLPNGPVSAEAAGVAFAEKMGIQGTGSEALQALRRLTAEQVCNKLNMASMGDATYSGPMIDGRLVVGDPETIYLSGAGAAVPLMVGANSGDLGFVPGDTKEALLTAFGPLEQQAKAAYDPTGTASVAQVRSEMGMDRVMVEPARFIASVFASRGLPSYEYRFSYVADSMRAEWKGAPHATEIPFVFDTVAARYGTKLTPADEKMAQQTLGYWVAFAKTGDPGTGDPGTGDPGTGDPGTGGSGVAWPRYSPGTDMILNFTQDGPVAEADPWKARLNVTAAYVSSSAPAKSDQGTPVKKQGRQK